MTNAMINKAKNAIEEAKERCSFAYEAGFKHYGKNYRRNSIFSKLTSTRRRIFIKTIIL